MSERCPVGRMPLRYARGSGPIEPMGIAEHTTTSLPLPDRSIREVVPCALPNGLHSHTDSERQALEDVLNASLRWLGADQAAVFLGRPESLCAAAAAGVSPDFCREFLECRCFMPLRRWLARRKIVHIPDIRADLRTLPGEAIAQREGYRALTLVPLVSEGVPIGALLLLYHQPRIGFTDDLSVIQTFASLAASSAGRSQAYEDSARRAERLTVLNETGVALSGAIELDSLYDLVFQQTSRVLPVDCFYIALWYPEKQTLRYCLYDHRCLFQKDLELPLGRGPSSWVIRHRKSYRVTDTSDPVHTAGQVMGEGEETRSALHVPMIHRNRIVGVMSVQSYQANAYSPEDLQMLETLAGQTAVAVENARLYRALNEAALTDDLTGLPNRRHMTQRLQDELARARRAGNGLCVLLLDLDFFKHVNDMFGHAAGDTVLQEVAALLKSSLRSTDLMGRWGGEEFLFVLPDTDRQGGMRAAEKLRKALEENAFLDGQLIGCPTGSFGALALETARDYDVSRVLEIADNSLYQAKAEGRNRVVFGG